MTPNLLKRFATARGLTLVIERPTPPGTEWSVKCWTTPGKSWKSTASHLRLLPGNGLITVPDWRAIHRALVELIRTDLVPCAIKQCPVCDMD